MNICKICKKETKNKVYCSEACQYLGYKELKVERILCYCALCSIKFEKTAYQINLGRGKYCSRKCKDLHQKELYKKEGNPAYGTQYTNEWKERMSNRIKEAWSTDEYRAKVKEGLEKRSEENGYWMGCSDESKLRRAQTNIKKYGVECVFSLEKFRTQSNSTCLKNHGKTSFQLMREGLKKNKKTGIELKIGNLLFQNNIKFETQYDVYYNNKNFKTYDFYLSDFNLLLEADGDYWHVNPIKYSSIDLLTEVQIRNKDNDKIKNKLAVDKGYNLERFWECDIKKKNFKFLLFNTLKKYAKDES